MDGRINIPRRPINLGTTNQVALKARRHPITGIVAHLVRIINDQLVRIIVVQLVGIITKRKICFQVSSRIDAELKSMCGPTCHLSLSRLLYYHWGSQSQDFLCSRTCDLQNQNHSCIRTLCFDWPYEEFTLFNGKDSTDKVSKKRTYNFRVHGPIMGKSLV